MWYVCTGLQIGQVAFRNTKSLNRIQSVVFEAAYTSNENLLICAPTGAGKTNIAMLTIVHELKQHLSQGVIKKDEFKVQFIHTVWNLSGICVFLKRFFRLSIYDYLYFFSTYKLLWHEIRSCWRM